MLSLSACSKASKVDMDTNALCSHLVKLAQVDIRDKSELELTTDCHYFIDMVKEKPSGHPIAVYANCIMKTDRFVDFKDCNIPFPFLANAQLSNESAQQLMHEAFSDLEKSESEEERIAASNKRKEAKAALESARETLAALQGNVFAAATQIAKSPGPGTPKRTVNPECEGSSDPLCGL